MKHYLIFCFLFSLNAVAQTTDTLFPGSQVMYKNSIKPADRTYRMALCNSDDSIYSSFVIQRSVRIENESLQFIQHFKFPKRSFTDSSFAKRSDFSPIRMSMSDDNGKLLMQLDFGKNTVNAFDNRTDSAKQVVHDMKHRYFDSNIMDYVIANVRYRKGTQYLVHFYTFEENGDDPYLLKYIGFEKRIVNGKYYKTIHVTTQSARVDNSSEPFLSHYWIDRKTRTVLQQEFSLGPERKTIISLIEE